MSYSVKPILHNLPARDGLHKIQIQVVLNRQKYTVKTNLKVKPEHFKDGRCYGFRNYAMYNGILLEECAKVERIVLDSIKQGKVTRAHLKDALNGTASETFTEWITRLTTEKRFSEKRVVHYRILADYIKAFGDFKMIGITDGTAQAFEQYCWKQGISQNTVNTKMKLFMAVVNYAAKNKACEKLTYTPPKYIQHIPEYLTLEEITRFREMTLAVQDPAVRQSGLFFILSCYTGYRLSDLKRFDQSFIKDGRILIRAKKNGQIVSIPLFTDLKAIVTTIGDLKLTIAEQTMRKYVKDIARLAGIHRHIKVHTARHSFAMMLMDKGFTINEAAELLGDSQEVAKIYARISNTRLDQMVLDRLG